MPVAIASVMVVCPLGADGIVNITIAEDLCPNTRVRTGQVVREVPSQGDQRDLVACSSLRVVADSFRSTSTRSAS